MLLGFTGTAAAETTGESESETDTGSVEAPSVEIISPADQASYPSAPASFDVQVEAAFIEPFEVQLLVDDVAIESTCNVSGLCVFPIELAAGEHVLLARVDGDGTLYDSAAVHVSVGDEEPGSTGEEPGSTGEEPGSTGEEPGSTGEEPGSSGEEPETAGETDAQNGGDDGGCAVDRGAGLPSMLLGVLGLIGWSRRRRS